jgi:hypothetical protein
METKRFSNTAVDNRNIPGGKGGKMVLKKIVLLTSVFVFILTFPLSTQVKKSSGISGALPIKKLKVTGTSQYLGYLNAYLNITRGIAPMKGLNIYLDKLQLTDRGGGIYSGGTPFKYRIARGNTIRITQKPSRLLAPRREKFKEILLGSYKVNNTIEWVFPKPDAVIPIGRTSPPVLLTRTIKFQWNYTGRVRRTKVTIKDFAKNIEIFNKVITGESVMVPRSLFKSGRKYRFDLEVVGPMGKFVMTPAVAPGSEVLFYYWDHLYFYAK